MSIIFSPNIFYPVLIVKIIGIYYYYFFTIIEIFHPIIYR